MAVELAYLHFVRLIGKLKDRRFLVLGGERHGLDLIVKDEASRRLYLLDFVDANGNLDGFRIAVLVCGNGIEQLARSVPHLEYRARKSALRVSFIELVNANARFEHGVVDGAVIVLHVQFAADGEREIAFEQMHGFIGDEKLLQVVIPIREFCFALSNALRVGGQYLHKHIGGNVANRLGGVKPEHIPFRKRVVEVDVLIVELFGDLANLHAACAKLVVRFDGHGHDGSVLILISKRHFMDSLVHDIRRRRVFFLHGVAAKRQRLRFRNAGIVRGQRCHDLAHAVPDLVHNASQPFLCIGGNGDVAILGFLGLAARQHIAHLFNADFALCRHVGKWNLCHGIRGDCGTFDLGGDDIRTNRGKLLQVHRAYGNIAGDSRTVLARGKLRYLAITVGIGVNAELYTRKHRATLAGLDHLHLAVSGNAHAEGGGCNDLCGGCAKENLLQTTVCRNIRRDVIHASRILALCRDGEALSCRRGRNGNGKFFAAPARVARNVGAGWQGGGIEGIAAVDVC